MQPERHRVVEDRVHGKREERHEAEEDEHDLTQHDGDLTHYTDGAHRRRKSQGRVVIHQHKRDAQEHKPEPPTSREAIHEGVRLGRHVVVVSGGQSPERDELASGRSLHLYRQRRHARRAGQSCERV